MASRKRGMRKEIEELRQIIQWGILASHHHLIHCLYLACNITDGVIDACDECIQNRICDCDQSVNSVGSESSLQHTGLKVTNKTSVLES